MNKFKKALLVFWSFFKIGLFTFGGGYAMISVISAELVERRKWITQEDMTDMLIISEMTPGAIAVNSATFVGYRVAGVPLRCPAGACPLRWRARLVARLSCL